jgi:5-methylcytosine-specific restriction endonuclease McrA
MLRQFQCSRCRGWYSEIFFRKSNDRRLRLSILGRNIPHYVCKGCENTARTEAKQPDRFIQKARWTIAHHAKKFEMPVAEFVRKYGWDTERLSHLLRHAAENTCQYCRFPYSDIDRAHDVTVDIRNPKEPPYLDTNVVVCCRTCNLAKSDMSPEDWGQILIDWRHWGAQQLILRNDPQPIQTELVFA